MKKILFFLFLIIGSASAERMSFGEFIQKATEEFKGNINRGKEYVKNTHEKNKTENPNEAIWETTKEVSVTGFKEWTGKLKEGIDNFTEK